MALQNDRLSLDQYRQNFADIHPPFETQDAAQVEANRCLFCYDAPCTKSCPTSIDVPKFIKQITTDNIKGSARTILTANILGAGCAQVCPVEKLCEGACVYNLMDEAPIPIAKLQRFSTAKAMAENWRLFERKPSTGKRVAVIGAGPAGLSCAHMLSREGVDVDIYEKEAKGGGLMTYGIAKYKVTNEFCTEEVDYITSLGGINIKYEVELGRNLSLVELQANYGAVYLAIGVGIARQLDIPGEELVGVADAIHFIYDIRTSENYQTVVGDKVVVIGMGMTAIDAATQAKRLGAKDVTLVYRRTEAEKPCTDAELNLAKLDGCKIIWLAAPQEIIGENHCVTGLRCSRMILGEPDESGRRAPVDTGELFTIEADMVIKAAGQTPFGKLIDEHNIWNKQGKIIIDENCMTNLKGLFAGGDAVNGGKEVVDAVQAGKNAAQAILKYLEQSE